MQVKCPKCGQALRVSEELLGKTVKCPKCAGSMRLAARRVPAPSPPAAHAPPPEPDVLDLELADEPAPGGGLRLADQPAPAGGGFRLAEEPAAGPGQQAGVVTGEKPVCYLTRDSDELRAVTRIFGKVRDVLPGEGLDYQFVDWDLRYAGPPELRPQDIHVTAGVDHSSYGSQLMRYFLTLFSVLFGWGACKLYVSGTVRLGDGSESPIQIKAKQGLGIFGGSDEGLMEANLKAAENGFAAQLAKGLTGRWITNFGAANLAKAALVCGLVGLIPFLGFILFLPALLMGGIAAATLLGRGVDKGKTMAIAGAVLGVVDLVISVAVTMSAN